MKNPIFFGFIAGQ